MARKRQPRATTHASGEPPSSGTPGTRRRQVTLDDDVARAAGAIAGALGITLPDYVNSRMKKVVAEELPEVLREELGITLAGH